MTERDDGKELREMTERDDGMELREMTERDDGMELREMTKRDDGINRKCVCERERERLCMTVCVFSALCTFLSRSDTLCVFWSSGPGVRTRPVEL